MKIQFQFQFLILALFLATFSSAQSDSLGKPVLIVVLGSSTAEGIGPSIKDSTWVNRYRTYVESFNSQNRVVNLAYRGYSTYQLLPSDTPILTDRPKVDTTRNIDKAMSMLPDGIIVNLPSNDVASDYSIQEQLNNFNTFDQIAREENVDIWMCTMQPKNFKKPDQFNVQVAVRDSIKSIYSNRFIDFWSGLADQDNRISPKYDCGDGTHLNATGHDVLLERVIDSKAFIRLLENSRTFEVNPVRKVLPVNMVQIGVKGILRPMGGNKIKDSLKIEFIQRNQVILTRQFKDTVYNVESLIDYRFPFQMVVSGRGLLTKTVEFDFTELDSTSNIPAVTIYPDNNLDFTLVPLEKMTIIPEGSTLSVAKFGIHTMGLDFRYNNRYVQEQQWYIQYFLQKKHKNKLVLYYENGNIKASIKFKEEKLHGKSKWYRESGGVERIAIYENGVLVKEID